ncbi:MAG TPA: hypothetical protein VFX22_01240, partial [Candidatus Kapabacteria bacterium]|nr:hypothetical protein [Candidatus Kapabacteria bacterium]
KGFDGTAFLSVDSGHTFCPCLQSTGEGACAGFLHNKGLLYVAAQKPFSLMESKDSGITWTAVGDPIDSLKHPHICSLLVQHTGEGEKFYVSTSVPAAIYTASDLGEPWRKCFTDHLTNYNRELPLVTSWGNRLVACIASGPHGPMDKIYFSENKGISWKSITCPFNIWGIGINASDTSTMWIGNYGAWLKSDTNISLQYSRDEGHTWNIVPNCKAQFFWQLQELPDRSLYAATDFGLIRVKLNE